MRRGEEMRRGEYSALRFSLSTTTMSKASQPELKKVPFSPAFTELLDPC